MRNFCIPIVVVLLRNLTFEIEHIEALTVVVPQQRVFMGYFLAQIYTEKSKPTKINWFGSVL
jgi:hypothetical protein